MSAESPSLGIEKHLLASRANPPDIVLSAIAKSPNNGTPILDIGAGDGRLVRSLHQLLPLSRVVLLDRDRQALYSNADHMPGTMPVTSDALHLPFPKNTFGLATSVNVAHEVCGAPSEGERRELFENYICEVKKVLRPGGGLIFYDGIMPSNADEIVELRPLSTDAQDSFDRFYDTYIGSNLSIDKTSKDEYKMTMADLVCFLTKYPYIDGEYWEDERTQLYPFLPQGPVADTLLKAGFHIKSTESPKKRAGLERFLQNYKISDFTIQNFPSIQVAISAKLEI